MSGPLAERHCVPCEGGTPPLEGEQVRQLLSQLGHGWALEDAVDHEQLWREYRTPDFVTAAALVQAITPVAEAERHHPDLLVGWGRLRVMLWTHAAGGLTENDFILAARIEQLASEAGYAGSAA